MHKRVKRVGALLCAVLLSVSPLASASTFKVIASFPVLEDLVKRIAGEDISVSTIVPSGADVHGWELTPPNVLAIEEADILFYNGFGLEPWLRHVQAMSDDSLMLKSVAENADFAPLPILRGQFKGTPDPHMWMDPQGAAAYVDHPDSGRALPVEGQFGPAPRRLTRPCKPLIRRSKSVSTVCPTPTES